MVMARSSMSKQLTGNRKKVTTKMATGGKPESKAKRAATKKGKQVAKQPKKVAKKTAKYRK